MKKQFLLLVLGGFSFLLNAQNVGIGTTTPSEKLDVNGNINVAGTIKANGVDGTAGQVLMKNNSGNMVWGSMMDEYKNFETFLSSGSWTVPTGVTKILVEVWGGGGGGSCYASGGGGGYISGYFTVATGNSLSFTVAAASPFNTTCTSPTSTNGFNSSISVNGITLSALGGYGSYPYSVDNAYNGWGGEYSVIPASFRNWKGMAGADGQINKVEYIPRTGISWIATYGGKGGDGGNSENTGGNGGGYINKGDGSGTGIRSRYTTPGFAKIPGGGGGGTAESPNPNTSGARGLVVIHY